MSKKLVHKMVAVDVNEAHHDIALIYAQEKFRQKLAAGVNEKGIEEITSVAEDFYRALGVLSNLMDSEIKRYLDKT